MNLFRAIRAGIVDGYDQPYDFNLGMGYDQPVRQFAYDLASYLGQFAGRILNR